jgi:hypothetical protein
MAFAGSACGRYSHASHILFQNSATSGSTMTSPGSYKRGFERVRQPTACLLTHRIVIQSSKTPMAVVGQGSSGESRTRAYRTVMRTKRTVLLAVPVSRIKRGLSDTELRKLKEHLGSEATPPERKVRSTA